MGRQKINAELPQVSDLFRPVIQALLELGGSGNIEEINEYVYNLMRFP
jgi:restriction system protein